MIVMNNEEIINNYRVASTINNQNKGKQTTFIN